MADTFPGSDFARVPPHNLDAERSALGGVLVKPVMFDELATTLGTDDFFLPAHREIFDAMMEISRRQQPIDVVSLGDELKSRGSLARLEGGAAYLIAIANAVPTAENIGHYVRLVKEKAIVRRMIAACAEIQSCGYGDFGEFGQWRPKCAQPGTGTRCRPCGSSSFASTTDPRLRRLEWTAK
ncbi:MAG: DnaB-like helicase N-terminal domain-containing protein [Polyangia bacterium]